MYVPRQTHSVSVSHPSEVHPKAWVTPTPHSEPLPSAPRTLLSPFPPHRLSQLWFRLHYRSPGLFLSLLSGLPASRLTPLHSPRSLRGPLAARTRGHVTTLPQPPLEIPSAPLAWPLRPFMICMSALRAGPVCKSSWLPSWHDPRTWHILHISHSLVILSLVLVISREYMSLESSPQGLVVNQ